MSEAGSAWEQYPGYRIDLVSCAGVGRVLHQGQVVAESDSCLLVHESEHDSRLYFPEAAVDWAQLQPSDHETVCPFKGSASYWSLPAGEAPLENVVWTYREPMTEVAGLKGYVSFDTDQLQVELIQSWSGEDHQVVTRFPIWGDAEDLLGLLDVTPVAENRFVGQPYPNPPVGTLIPELKEKRRRSVVEGGHQLGQAIVAASKTIPNQRVTSASMIFSKAASFEEPLEVQVNVLRGGRNFSTLSVNTVQQEQLRSAGILLMDACDQDCIRKSMPMPDVAGPENAKPLDMKVSGREIRVVDGAYTNDIEHLGPPELYAWIRFREAPAEAYLNAALMTQATTHWTIAAALRPHPGLSQAQGVGKIFARDGRLLATYSVHSMVRDMIGGGGRNAM